MTSPRRVQLSRAKGWRKPDGVVTVARPGRFGNPFLVGDARPDGGTITSRDEAVDLFSSWFEGHLDAHPQRREDIRANLSKLSGRDLACWCPLTGPCHADVLIRLANP